MSVSYKRDLKLMLLGLTGAGKSRLGNKLSGKKEFEESSASDSCTKKINKVKNQFNIEIIDSQGLADTDNEDKKGLISIFNEIKEDKPNVLAYVQNASDHRFGENSKKAIEEICKMFDTKSIWNHFIIIFTFASSVSKKNRETKAKNFTESILKVLRNYYNTKKVNDNLPIPEKLRYYFVELGDDDEYKMDQDTINSLTDIMKLIHLLPPISNTKEKIIVEIRTKRNCQQSIRKYDRIVDSTLGAIAEKVAYAGDFVGSVASSYGTGILTGAALISANAPLALTFIGSVAVGELVFIPMFASIGIKIDKADLSHKVDDNHQNEDYITYDEEIYVYHDGTTETKRINVQNFTRIISK